MWVFILAVLLGGCSWVKCAATSPQAAVDYFDWVRERNEKAIYEKTIDRIEELGAPYCSLDRNSASYPVIFPILGVQNPRFIPEANAVVYPLGDHEILRHEMAHAILVNGDASLSCLHQLAAVALQKDLEPQIDWPLSSDRMP